MRIRSYNEEAEEHENSKEFNKAIECWIKIFEHSIRNKFWVDAIEAYEKIGRLFDLLEKK